MKSSNNIANVAFCIIIILLLLKSIELYTQNLEEKSIFGIYKIFVKYKYVLNKIYKIAELSIYN